VCVARINCNAAFWDKKIDSVINSVKVNADKIMRINKEPIKNYKIYLLFMEKWKYLIYFLS